MGRVTHSAPADIEAALEAAHFGAAAWASMSVEDRASRVRRVADLYEANAAELFALAAREAGKTWLDGVGEVREACDFARFYANEALRECSRRARTARGVVACISPWNFALAIFSGQILAAVSAGNAVLAKPAEQTPLIAARAVALMHEAGIPRDVVQLLPGDGATVGTALARDPRVDGVCFTGSTATARLINRAMAEHLAPDAPLIAETGGLNAMILDSTALPEQAVRDIVTSAFQSAGQRCSALRILYVQREVEERILEMLFGAIDELHVGDPWDLATDVGPVIDDEARERIESYCRHAERDGRALKRLSAPVKGRFVPPTVLRVDGIESLAEEIFGPVLHIATYDADRIDAVVDAVNAAGYGLTFGLHTRIDDRVQHIVDRVRAGNIYVNRNQIGAVVGSQPFGGEGASGTGPKAGGPHYVRRLTAGASVAAGMPAGLVVDGIRLAAAVSEASRAMTARPHRGGRTERAQHEPDSDAGGAGKVRPQRGGQRQGDGRQGGRRRDHSLRRSRPNGRRPIRTARPPRPNRRIEPVVVRAARSGALPRPRDSGDENADCDGARRRKRRGGGRGRGHCSARIARSRSTGRAAGRSGRPGVTGHRGRHRRGRLQRGPRRAGGHARSAGPAPGPHPAADHGAGGSRALRARTPRLRRHDGCRRQRIAARSSGRLTIPPRRKRPGVPGPAAGPSTAGTVGAVHVPGSKALGSGSRCERACFTDSRLRTRIGEICAPDPVVDLSLINSCGARSLIARLRQLGPLTDDNLLIFRDRTPKGRHYTERPGDPLTGLQDSSFGAGCFGNAKSS